MSTRGFVGFVVDGAEKIMQNRSSSYPSWLGREVVTDLTDYLAAHTVTELAATARALVDPTGTDPHALLETHAGMRRLRDANPSMPQWSKAGPWDEADWHNVLSFDSLAETLDVGLYKNASPFPVYGGFCEWGYLVDLDARVLEVYRGLRAEFPTEGRWANRPTRREMREDYEWHLRAAAQQGRSPWMERVPRFKAVHPVASWGLNRLPDPDEMGALENRVKGWERAARRAG